MNIAKTVVALLVCVCFLGACGESKVVLDCAKPTTIATTTGLKVGGDVSINTAQAAISASLGKELTADFAAADPNTWFSIAATYQYQTCQFLNSTSCDDLPKSECLTKKKEILNEAFDKINGQIKEERDRQETEKARQASTKIDACVSGKVAAYESEKKVSTEGGARARAPGLLGGRNTDTRDVCHSVGPDQRIVSASTDEISCFGGRCSVTAPTYSENYRKVCVNTTAWSASRSGGGGGSARYRLDVIFKNIATPEQVRQFIAACGSPN